MNKYVLMLAAAGLIAAAPAYYAFQAQAEEAAPVAEEATASPTDETPTDEAKQDAATTESATETKESKEDAAE